MGRTGDRRFINQEVNLDARQAMVTQTMDRLNSDQMFNNMVGQGLQSDSMVGPDMVANDAPARHQIQTTDGDNPQLTPLQKQNWTKQ